jgi:hypothetical protein
LELRRRRNVAVLSGVLANLPRFALAGRGPIQPRENSSNQGVDVAAIDARSMASHWPTKSCDPPSATVINCQRGSAGCDLTIANATAKLIPFALAKMRRRGQRENHHRFAWAGANVLV